MTAVLSSAAGMLSLLDEPEPEIKAHALTQLNKNVDMFWSEIASAISKIEELSETEADADTKTLASIVASKVFFHLEELDDALKYALAAGDRFDIEDNSDFVQTLVSKCIDEYVKQSTESSAGEEESKVDDRLTTVVERMFERCYSDGQFKQALGIALESHRMDHVRKAALESGDVAEMLAHCFELANTVVSPKEYRHSVLRVLVEMYQQLEVPDYINMCQCLLLLDDAEAIASALEKLLGKEDGCLIAYQVAFDLEENQNIPFLDRICQALSKTANEVAAEEKTDAPAGEQSESDAVLGNLKTILRGELSSDLTLHFLYSQNKSDMNILNQIRDRLEVRNTVTHNATIMANALMHCGTTVDTFLRENQEWLRRATNWAKFTATASIGVIHKDHHQESLQILAPFLPQEGQATTDPYQEGGALYALGLIHFKHGKSRVEFLKEALTKASANEVVQHGAALGLGLAAMASEAQEVYEQLHGVVCQESAVAGEAAAVAMGLVLVGSGNGAAIEEMLAYAHETQHEKIVRGLAMGIALVVYGQEEEADVVIEQLIRDKDPTLRYGAMLSISTAYVGTGNNSAIRKLLHVAVSDVSDDVRRAAVSAIGFVLCSKPKQVPRIVSLLAESYNPHVRFGACMAVGVACSGTAMKEAINLLEPLCKDRVDFVRQGAYIAMAMVLIQSNAVNEPKVQWFRKKIDESLKVKGDTVTKFGSVLAAGILDAGGRNVTMSLVSPAGHTKLQACVGLLMFPQFWYWFPYAHMISLAMSPTAVVGLNKNLKMPRQLKFRSSAPPSQFAYPAPIEIKKVEIKVKVKKATLSVTSRAKARALRRSPSTASVADKAEKTPMDTTDGAVKTAANGEKGKKAMDTSEESQPDDKIDKPSEDEEKAKEKKPEESFEILSNPARITSKQQSVLSCDKGQRYVPVKRVTMGVIMVRDSTPEEEEDVVVPKPPVILAPGISADEPEPPTPFQFSRFDDYR